MLPSLPRFSRAKHSGIPVEWLARHVQAIAIAIGFAVATVVPANAQSPEGWSMDLDLTPAIPKSPDEGKTTVKKNNKSKKNGAASSSANTSHLQLTAQLTADGQRIEEDVVWRIFKEGSSPGTLGKMLAKRNEPSPMVALEPGIYAINASFGRANLTRRITVGDGVQTTEPFVLNAGGLRIRIAAITGTLEGSKAHYDIFTDERDQRGDRAVVLSQAKPGTIIRLNSGIYHIISKLGDANATVDADVTVEAGKLTEATVNHKAGRVTLKLVTRQGGEALPDTQWKIVTSEGQDVKTSVGALPSHILSPGRYVAVATSQGQVYRRDFEVSDGQKTEVEVLRQ